MISVNEFIDSVLKSKVVCFDIEHELTTKWNSPDFDIHGCGFSTLQDGKIISEYYTKREDIQRILSKCFNSEIEAIAHNAQFDLKGLKAAGYKYSDPNIRDTIVLLAMYDENKKEYGLKQLTKELYGHQMDTYKEASAEGLDTKRFYEYGKDDVYWTLRLYNDYIPKITAQKQLKLYNLLMQSMLVLADMCFTGMHWDVDYGQQLFVELLSKKYKLEKAIRAKIGKINIDSSDQLAARLFRDLGYSTKGLEYTPTGKLKLDESAMEKLARKYPVCQMIVSYRKLGKLLSTYITPLCAEAESSFDGRVHSSYSMHSNTGRWRSSDHNLQNIPTSYDDEYLADIKIRQGFSAPQGKKLIVSDYSQLELRTAAVVTKDPEFIKAYTTWDCKICGNSGTHGEILHSCPKCGVPADEESGFWHGQDKHTQTAQSVSILEGDRKKAKVFNLSIIYNVSAYRLAQQIPGLSVDDAELGIKQYLQVHKGVAQYHKQVKKLYDKGMPLIGLMGKRRLITDEDRRKHYKHGLNIYSNFAGQWSGSFIAQMGMVKLRKLWIEKGWWLGAAKLVNFIHDELVCEVDEEIAEEAAKDVQLCMETAVKCGIPFRAEPAIVNTWHEGK